MLVHNGSHLNDEYYTCPPYYNYTLKVFYFINFMTQSDINEPNKNKKITIPDRWETEYKSSFKPHLARVKCDEVNLCNSNQGNNYYSNQNDYEEEYNDEEYPEEDEYEEEYDVEDGTQTDLGVENNGSDINSEDFDSSSSITQPKIVNFVKTQYRKATLNKTKILEKNKPVQMKSSFCTQTIEDNKKPQIVSDPLLNTGKTKSILTTKSEYRDKVDLRKMIDYPSSNPQKEKADRIRKYKESKINKEKEKLKKVESKILNVYKNI